MVMHLALLLALVSRWKERQANVPNFETSILSSGIVHNVVCLRSGRALKLRPVPRNKDKNEAEHFLLLLPRPFCKHNVTCCPSLCFHINSCNGCVCLMLSPSHSKICPYFMSTFSFLIDFAIALR